MKQILIVDDDQDFTSIVKIRLEKEGFSVTTVNTGKEAFHVVEQNPPNLIVMDVMMPHMDGLAALRQINRLTNKKIPVIIVTGSAVMLEQAFMLEGACVFLQKPVEGQKLADAIKKNI